jgi:short subunit dehydrogenase-like uncharacterized protein
MQADAGTKRELDLVVWGATGFTGNLVAEHVAQHAEALQLGAWAIGGRNREKLERVQQQLASQGANVPQIVIGDSHDRSSLEAIARRATAICSTVGPYTLYGSELVSVCAREGTHYCDLTGEVPWMRRMIDQHEQAARDSGSRIVHCCGFDSIPSDLGCWLVSEQMEKQHGMRCRQIKCRVKSMRGGFSGGTIASMAQVMEESRNDSSVRRLVQDPYALNPADRRTGPDRNDTTGVEWDAQFGAWIAPFVMAPINTRVVRRSNALLDYGFGEQLLYDEAVMMGTGPSGWFRARLLADALRLLRACESWSVTRKLLRQWAFPQQGDGPDERSRLSGSFEMLFLATGQAAAAPHVRLSIYGDRDPGYGATSRMLAESAASLAQDTLQVEGGFWTPASCFGQTLVDRLKARGGMRFEITS